MAVLVPGTHTGFNFTSFKKGAAEATYQDMVFIPFIEDYGMKLGTTGTMRKAARMTSSVLSQTAEGNNLTASTMIDTASTLTAAGNYVAVYWSENEKAQLDFALNQLASGEVTRALAEGTDTIALATVTGATQTMTQAGVDATMLRQGQWRLGGNTNGEAMPAGGRTVYALFSHTQGPNLAAIPEFNSAEMRGDAENPYVKGVFLNGSGMRLAFSTAVAQDANGWHNVVFVKEAFEVGWNSEKAQVEQSKLELQNRVIAFNNLGVGIQHQLRLIALRTTASAL